MDPIEDFFEGLRVIYEAFGEATALIEKLNMLDDIRPGANTDAAIDGTEE